MQQESIKKAFEPRDPGWNAKVRAMASPYSCAAIRLASMSKKTSPQFSAHMTPCSSIARSHTSARAIREVGCVLGAAPDAET